MPRSAGPQGQRPLERFGGGEPAESHPEIRLAAALIERNVPVEHQSTVVRRSRGREARIDLAVPAVRWGVELDIHPEHRTLEGDAGDARRYRDLHGCDWQVEPVSEQDMRCLSRLPDELADLYRTRCLEVRRQSSVS